ncbi:11050_t:CDS:1 [Cetraspora pellucida]|uniref:11050_t:CDS:1 n=1 Tax=Cetraspora pellucida TaxID=1433469 RepID=A0ACA9PCV7_9GLOM|nr:11050_t:CDS:1 [Cetraspora pellucida]
MSVISGNSEPEKVPLGSSPSSVISLPIQNDYTIGTSSIVNGTQSVMTAATANTILPPDQANINFKPATTAITKVNKLKLQVSLDSTIYTAGGILTGRLVLSSTTSRSLKLGEISCELTAYEGNCLLQRNLL